jgi:hypothetical protein
MFVEVLLTTVSTIMPSARRAMPSIIHSIPDVRRRIDGFSEDPVDGISRPFNAAGKWVAEQFEMHARKCSQCHSLHNTPSNYKQLCKLEYRLAHEISV